MASEWKPRSEYAKERERAEIAARKQKQEESHDPVVEQAVVAFVNYRQGGGEMRWEQFQRQWYLDRERRGEQG